MTTADDAMAAVSARNIRGPSVTGTAPARSASSVSYTHLTLPTKA